MTSCIGKYRGLKILMVSALIWGTCRTAFAEDSNDASAEIPLEQRLQKRVSVEFRKTPIEDVIRIMAEQADVDLVKSPNVKGDVTVTLTDVPLAEALNNILAVQGCIFVPGENMIRIITATEKVERPEILQTKTFEITYADVIKVVKALEKFKSAQGSVSHIEGTSHIMVTDTESKIRDVTDFVNKIDRMTPQILVEARIYDITSKDRFDLGIQWEAGRNTTYPPTGGNPSGRTDPFMSGGFNGTITTTENTTAALRLGWLNQSIDLDFLLQAQQENFKAKLLANPRILVLDNETAKIKIISEIPYQELTESAMGGSIGTTAFREVGVELEVTPHLAMRDDMIRLQLKPVFSVVTGEVQVAGVGVSYPQPVVDRREADTTLLIRDGQTVVLGGLRKKDVTQQINKVPLLGDLPLAGALFRFKGEKTIISELVVFITPRIVDQVDAMSQSEKKVLDTTRFEGPDAVQTEAEMRISESKD
jgi:type IV pilus assembly protein PilQ